MAVGDPNAILDTRGLYDCRGVAVYNTTNLICIIVVLYTLLSLTLKNACC